MSNSAYPYQETLLQWVWQELEFDTTSLRTAEGQPVEIIEPGELNTGAGPDFLGASFRIGPLKLFGDVEIHIHPGHWSQHNHQRSERFNRVVLHVVYDGGCSPNSSPAVRPDGTTPPLLRLKPFLQKSLIHLFERKRQSSLPCSGNLRYISQEAFEAQVVKAHRHYFEYKTDFLIERYDSDLPLSKAWLKMLSRGLFHTLGIPRNRSEMEQFHDRIYRSTLPTSLNDFIRFATSVAFDKDSGHPIEWITSGMRPASLPSKRVTQAAALYFTIHNLPFKSYLSTNPEAWTQIIRRIPDNLQPGGQMRSILRHTVFYPATYLLGEFLHAQPLKQFAYQQWVNAPGNVPGEVVAPFRSAGFIINKKTLKPGLAHQLKRYCRPLNCHRCKVFKKAINP
ncbi:DUF2851 family protein [Rhodohalobacter sp. 8-1]|uniref:DUF2851 family protein n=1 Tax=Rhodohalobacter sp. 8-1 TaxID=3131972 RepID=UPI0030EBB39E